MNCLCCVRVLDGMTNVALVMCEVVCSDCVCLHAVSEVCEWFSVESQAPTSAMNYSLLSSLLPQHGI